MTWCSLVMTLLHELQETGEEKNENSRFIAMTSNEIKYTVMKTRKTLGERCGHSLLKWVRSEPPGQDSFVSRRPLPIHTQLESSSSSRVWPTARCVVASCTTLLSTPVSTESNVQSTKSKQKILVN